MLFITSLENTLSLCFFFNLWQKKAHHNNPLKIFNIIFQIWENINCRVRGYLEGRKPVYMVRNRSRLEILKRGASGRSRVSELCLQNPDRRKKSQEGVAQTQSLRLIGRGAKRGVVRSWNRHWLAGLRQSERFGGGFLARPLFRDREELRGVGVQRGGRSAGRAGGGQRWERRLANRNGWREHADLLVGGLLDPTLELSHLIHCHVFKKRKKN